MTTLSAKFSSLKQTGFLRSDAGRWVAGAALAALLAAPVAIAATNTGDDTDGQAAVAQANTQIRAVRLSSVEGSVTIQRGGETQFSQAYANMPLIEGSAIETSDSGRAEIEFEDGSVVRITPNSTLSLNALESGPGGVLTSDIELERGLAYFELRHSELMPFTVEFNGRIAQPVTNTTFRINLDATPLELAVLSGRTQVRQDEQGGEALYAVNVKKNETIRFDESDASRYFLTEGVAGDSWDDWNADRDKEAAAMASHHTNAANAYSGGGYGWSDLDYYGNWYPVPGYGLMWQPGGGFIGAGFDPYGCGYWAYYPGFGQTWVSCYAWGWAPFHGGSWSYVDGFGWGWLPGSGGGGYFLPVTPVHGGPTGYKPPRKPNGGLTLAGKGGGLIAVNRGPAVSGGGIAGKGGAVAVASPAASPVKGTGRPVVVNGQAIEPLKTVPVRVAAVENPALERDAPLAIRSEAAMQASGSSKMQMGGVSAGNGGRTVAPTAYRGASAGAYSNPAQLSGAQRAIGQRVGPEPGAGNAFHGAANGSAGFGSAPISRPPAASYSGGARSSGGGSMGAGSGGARMGGGGGGSSSAGASHASSGGSSAGSGGGSSRAH